MIQAWLPLSDDVFFFDTECVFDNSDYIWILERLSVLSKKAFSPSNIQCTLHEEEGVVNLSFEWNHVMYDWNLVYKDD